MASEIKREELDSFLTIRIFLRCKEKGKRKKKKKKKEFFFSIRHDREQARRTKRRKETKERTHRDVTRPLKSHAASLPERVHVRIAVLPIDTP
jgi:hypothetical protein